MANFFFHRCQQGALLTKRSVLLLLVSGSYFLSVFPQIATNEGYRLRTVVIDPGHGGKDPGALGTHTTEKEVVLAIALKLGTYIEALLDDVKVIYTRTTDEFVPLYKRAEIANSNKADLFISIHANATNNRAVKGTETLVLGQHRAEENFEIAKKENEVILLEDDYHIRYQGFDPDSPESYIMLTLMQNSYFKYSITFADFVQEQFRERARRADRSVKQQGLLVLAQTAMPGVMVEVGFITNPDEQKYLQSDEGQDHIASAIFRAFRDYKAHIEMRSAALKASRRENDNGQPVNEPKATNLPVETKAETPPHDPQTIQAIPRNSTTQSPAIQKANTAKPVTNIVFMVQVTVSSKPIPVGSEIFRGMNDVTEIREGNLYKYAVGSANSYNEITEYRKWVTNKFHDAFIIAVKEGEIITMEQAFRESNL